MRLFPYSYWLLWNCSVKFAYQKFPNFKASRQILIPYKFIQRWNTRVKPKSVFFASKGLETFHAFAGPYVNTVATRMPAANRNARDPCEVPRGSAQDSISRETCSVCDCNSRSISLGRRKLRDQQRILHLPILKDSCTLKCGHFNWF